MSCDAPITLFVGKRKLLQIERDAAYPQMWRVRLPDGRLSDMINLTRAKDAALDIAEGIEAQKTPHKSPLKSLKFFWRSRPPIAANGSGLSRYLTAPKTRCTGQATSSAETGVRYDPPQPVGARSAQRS